MNGNTILLHFQVARAVVINGETTLADMLQVLEKYICKLSLVKWVPIGEGFLTLYTGPQNSFVTIRGFVEGMISVNFEYLRNEEQEDILNPCQVNEMAECIAQVIGSQKYEHLPPLKRTSDYKYDVTTDHRRIIENNIDKVLFRERSLYQKVMIAHSASFGNMLYIDGWINHSSKDLIYTETLMQRGKEDYCGKDILILGGGDGSTLWELLKENPKSVLMVEIDEVVVRACRTHMREVNGGILDHFNGPNHEIIIGDCVKYLRSFAGEGRKFDYVFACLTDFPCSEEGNKSKTNIPAGSMKQIVMNLSFNVLKPMGKYMCHSADLMPTNLKSSWPDSLKMEDPVDFSTDVVWVPSFMEFWQFHQIWRKNSSPCMSSDPSLTQI